MKMKSITKGGRSAASGLRQAGCRFSALNPARSADGKHGTPRAGMCGCDQCDEKMEPGLPRNSSPIFFNYLSATRTRSSHKTRPSQACCA